MVKGTVGDAVSVPRYRRLEVDSSLTPSSSDTRSAARQTVAGWLWTAAGPIFLVAQLDAGRAWRTPYSWSRNNISDLGNVGCGPWGDDRRYVCSPLHDVMNFGLVITRILIAAGVILLWQSPHRPNRLGGILILLAGVGYVAAGLGPADRHEISMSCSERCQSSSPATSVSW
jgi:Protein of unknown function (DUF998)